MIPVKDAAIRLGVTVQRVRQLLKQGRIRGATKIGRDWMIPTDVHVRKVKMGRPPVKRNRSTLSPVPEHPHCEPAPALPESSASQQALMRCAFPDPPKTDL